MNMRLFLFFILFLQITNAHTNGLNVFTIIVRDIDKTNIFIKFQLSWIRIQPLSKISIHIQIIVVLFVKKSTLGRSNNFC